MGERRNRDAVGTEVDAVLEHTERVTARDVGQDAVDVERSEARDVVHVDRDRVGTAARSRTRAARAERVAGHVAFFEIVRVRARGNDAAVQAVAKVNVHRLSGLREVRSHRVMESIDDRLIFREQVDVLRTVEHLQRQRILLDGPLLRRHRIVKPDCGRRIDRIGIRCEQARTRLGQCVADVGRDCEVFGDVEILDVRDQELLNRFLQIVLLKHRDNLGRKIREWSWHESCLLEGVRK